MGVVYNVKPLRSKDLPIFDVLSESVNNPIRFLIGWYLMNNIIGITIGDVKGIYP